ncbi:MAG: neutral/alkaline non-lysosomal ceramidase N-terminal domain-containing protein, partial [Pseudobdellovibrio sp.]
QQGKKHILLDHRTGLFVGLPLKVWKLIPSPAPEAAYFSECAKKNALETLPWVPSVIPLQIIKLGNISFVAVPGEITTIAARRLKAALAEKLSGTEIIVSSYANGFMGYITTPEEYDMQCYEGGHTIYGRNTLPVLIEAYLDLLDPKSDLNCRKLKSFQFPEAELKLRTIE